MIMTVNDRSYYMLYYALLDVPRTYLGTYSFKVIPHLAAKPVERDSRPVCYVLYIELRKSSVENGSFSIPLPEVYPFLAFILKNQFPSRYHRYRHHAFAHQVGLRPPFSFAAPLLFSVPCGLVRLPNQIQEAASSLCVLL
jgi:hypothetical protein